MTFLNETEKIKAEIKVLQKKLDFLEQLNQTKTPCEEAFKRVFSYYPEGCEKSFWISFQKGYEAATQDYKVGEYQETAQEPKPKEEPKTLYQTLCDSGWNEWSANDACDIVKEWIYEYNCDNYEACREYLNGYQECQTVLEERLK